MSRTLTAPPTDERMWKSLLRLVHPDTYGDHDLFIWTSAVYERAGDAPEEAPPHARREPPKHHARTTSSDRVSFDSVFDRFASHEELTRHAIRTAEQVGEPYASLLRLLADCYEAVPHDDTLECQQNVGVTYKSLAFAAHRSGMSTAERVRWYRVAENIPLSQNMGSWLHMAIGDGSPALVRVRGGQR